jgi:3-dehydroquinate dehydratase-2
MSKTLFVLNGPNLNRLGRREPEIYGHHTLDDVHAMCAARTDELGWRLEFRQTNFEGALVESVHEAIDQADGLIINPAGLTFTSVPVMDALKMFSGPKIELHISNVHAREAVYHRSLMSPVVTAVMAGFGVDGYRLAVDWMARRLTSV